MIYDEILGTFMADMNLAGYTVGQVAKLLGCSIRSLYRWEKEGLIPIARRLDCGAIRTRVYNDADLDEIRKFAEGRLTYIATLRAQHSSSMQNERHHDELQNERQGDAPAIGTITAADSVERKRLAADLLKGLGLANRLALPGPETSLPVFEGLAAIGKDQWQHFPVQLASEPGLAANEEVARILTALFSDLRDSLSSQRYLAASALLKEIIGIATDFSKDPELVCLRIHLFCVSGGLSAVIQRRLK